MTPLRILEAVAVFAALLALLAVVLLPFAVAMVLCAAAAFLIAFVVQVGPVLASIIWARPYRRIGEARRKTEVRL